jgi:hypothetical protein
MKIVQKIWKENFENFQIASVHSKIFYELFFDLAMLRFDDAESKYEIIADCWKAYFEFIFYDHTLKGDKGMHSKYLNQIKNMVTSSVDLTKAFMEKALIPQIKNLMEHRIFLSDGGASLEL